MNRRVTIQAVLDAVLVVLFAVLGRASHEEGVSLGGVLATAWPFLAALAVGWVLVHSRSRQWPLTLGPGITVWLVTLVLGMLLRAVTGAGTAPAFVAVAATVLALLLLGSRVVLDRVLGAPYRARHR